MQSKKRPMIRAAYHPPTLVSFKRTGIIRVHDKGEQNGEERTSSRPVGHAKNSTTPLRQWSAPSYNADTGRAHSSVDAQNSSEHVFAGNHAGKCSAQIPDGFGHIDKRRSTEPYAGELHRRPQTKVHE
jgi:hypothetical protein